MLYARGQKQISLEDVRAVMGDKAEARVEEAVDAAGAGDLVRLDLALERLWIADLSPVAVLRLAMSHFQRLLLVGAESQRGESIDGAMRKLRPPVHLIAVDIVQKPGAALDGSAPVRGARSAVGSGSDVQNDRCARARGHRADAVPSGGDG